MELLRDLPSPAESIPAGFFDPSHLPFYQRFGLFDEVLEWSYAAGETDVRTETLQAAAELLTLRRNTIRMIDGAGPSVEVHPPEQAQGSVIGTEPGVEPPPDPPKRRRKKTTETARTNTEMASPAPSDIKSV